MSINHIRTVFIKQAKDTMKNKSVLIQFILYPVIALAMELSIEQIDMPKNFFVILFATIFIGMTPLSSMSAFIAEEKEGNTMRVLLMANVKPMEYLFGVGSFLFGACMLGGVAFALIGQFAGVSFLYFMLVMAIGTLASMIVGAVIGTWCKNQMSAMSISIPVMMIFAFLPMLAMFNNNIAKISKFTYSQQISDLLGKVEQLRFTGENIVVVVAHIVIATVLFVIAYKRSGLV